MQVIGNEAVVPLRSVESGNVFDFIDDGYVGGDKSKMGSGRAHLVRQLERLSADGQPTWFAVEQPRAWKTSDGKLMEPPPLLVRQVWNEDCDRRFAGFKGELEAYMAELRERDPESVRTTLGHKQAASLKAKADGEAASAAKQRGGRKPKAKADGEAAEGGVS